MSFWLWTICAGLVAPWCSGTPAAEVHEKNPATRVSPLHVDFFGDLRLRWEQDFDSITPTGAARADRDRIRARIRAGAKGELREGLAWFARLRSGDHNSQQSPHITLWQDEGDRGNRSDINLDRLYLKWQPDDRSTFFLGRDGLAIWKPNEFLWDDDVFVDGVSFARARQDNPVTYSIKAGAALLPDGDASHTFDERSHVAFGQFVHARQLSQGKLTVAEAVLFIHDRNGVANAVNDDTDLLISYTNVQFTNAAAGAAAYSVGLDVMYNFRHGPSGDHLGDRFGFDLYATLGRFKYRGDWRLGYTFARIEKWSVPRFMAQDDWFRFGTATQTRSSDYRGHEFSAGYVITDRFNILARYFLVDALTTVENGQRFRVDFNVPF